MGLSSAIGEYVVFLDSDDWLDEDIVELALKNTRRTASISGALYATGLGMF